VIGQVAETVILLWVSDKTGSRNNCVTEIFLWLSPSGRTTAPG